jgi:hypothetical protein
MWTGDARQNNRAARVLSLTLLAAIGGACGGSPARPSRAPLPVVNESASFRYHYAAGDRVDRRLAGELPPMGRQPARRPAASENRVLQVRKPPGHGRPHGPLHTNGYAEPALFEIHTLWSTDNHEVVHIYTALVGRPSELLQRGIAVALQTDPAASQFQAVFNGQEVHQACRQYLRAGRSSFPSTG